MSRSPYRGALLGALVGDALGAPFERHHGVVSEDRLAAVLADSSVLPFTDDTALTVALAESILRVGGLDEHDTPISTFPPSPPSRPRAPNARWGAATRSELPSAGPG